MDQQITERDDDDVTLVTPAALAADPPDEEAPTPGPVPEPQPDDEEKPPAAAARAAVEVEVMPNVTMSLDEVLALHAKDCRKCTRGWVTLVVPGGERKRLICECAVNKARRRLAAARQRQSARTAPAAPPARAEREKVQAHGRVQRLAEQLQGLQADLDRRQAEYQEQVAPIEAELRADQARLAVASADELDAGAQAERLAVEIAETERLLEHLRQRQARASDDVIEAQHMKATLVAEIARGQALLAHEKDRFDVGIARLQREMAKLSRRITAVRIYNPALDRSAEAAACAP